MSGNGRPTPDEQELLARIVNTKQKAALVAAIERGEQIPTFAWHPLPAGLDLDGLASTPGMQRMHEQLDAVSEESEAAMNEAIGEIDLGWKVTEFIDSIRDEEVDELGFLKTPVSAYDELWDNDASTLLAQWVILNPFGPTAKELKLYHDRLKSRWALGMAFIHPIEREVTVYAVLTDDQVGHHDTLLTILRELFDRNGSSTDGLLLAAFPSSVSLGECDLSDEEFEQLFRLAAAKYLDARDLDEACRLLEQFKGDPRARVSRELELALNGLDDEEDSADRPSNVTDQGMADFSRWWSLVSDPDHADLELDLFLDICSGQMR